MSGPYPDYLDTVKTNFHVGLAPKIWKYYTYLNLLLVVLTLFTPQLHKYYNILLGSLLTLIGSFVVFYLHPGYIKIHTLSGKEYAMYNWFQYTFFDIFTHILPLIIVAILYGKYYRKYKWSIGTWVTLLVIALYMAVIDPKKVYDTSPYNTMVTLAIVLAIYVAIV
jgi:hypothetical protein